MYECDNLALMPAAQAVMLELAERVFQHCRKKREPGFSGSLFAFIVLEAAHSNWTVTNVSWPRRST